jgi:hypothetical protein
LFDEEKGKRKRRLVWAAVAVALLIIAAFAVGYVNLTNALSSALSQSLNTFDLNSVVYPLAGPDWIDLNITFLMRNPTSYPVKLNAITLSFRVDGRDIVGVPPIEPNQELSPGESYPYSFLRNVTDAHILSSLNSETYTLTIKGKISASVSYLLFSASRSRDIDSARIVNGVG